MLGLYAKAQTDSVAADSAAATAAAPFRFIRAKQAALPAAPIRRPPPLRIAADFVQRQLPLRPQPLVQGRINLTAFSRLMHASHTSRNSLHLQRIGGPETAATKQDGGEYAD
jgi:hypothetical protein